MLMLRYASMASDPAKTAAYQVSTPVFKPFFQVSNRVNPIYQTFAKYQLDYALGSNPMAGSSDWGISFIEMIS